MLVVVGPITYYILSTDYNACESGFEFRFVSAVSYSINNIVIDDGFFRTLSLYVVPCTYSIVLVYRGA